MSTDDLAVRRVRYESDNVKVNPTDLLRMVIADIEAGHVPCDGVVVLVANRPSEGDHEYTSYRSGMTQAQECLTLTIAQDRFIRQARGEI